MLQTRLYQNHIILLTYTSFNDLNACSCLSLSLYSSSFNLAYAHVQLMHLVLSNSLKNHSLKGLANLR